MISLKNISMKYDNLQVLKNFNITFENNKITCLVGPSGVGKTTIVNIVANLIKPIEGQIEGIENSIFSYVFQEPRLLEWYSIYDNIDFVLKDIYNSDERKRIISNYLDLVGLEEYKDYKPSALSGGMAQRISLARAFAYPSNVLIMDEPFKGLDMKLKQEMISSFQKLWQKSSRTVIFITHDIDEAVTLSHTIYVIKNRPAEIVEKFDNISDENRLSIKEILKNKHFS